MLTTRIPARQVIALSALEAAANGYTHMCVVNHTDLDETTANTAQTLELLDVGAGSVVQACAVHVRTPFQNSADAAFNTTTIEVGDGGSVARFLASQEVNVNGTEVLTKAGTGTLLGYNAADTVDIKVTSMAAKSLSSLDTGSLVVFLRIAELAPLAKAAIQTQ